MKLGQALNRCNELNATQFSMQNIHCLQEYEHETNLQIYFSSPNCDNYVKYGVTYLLYLFEKKSCGTMGGNYYHFKWEILGFNFFTIQISYYGQLSSGKERQSFLGIVGASFPRRHGCPWQIGSIFWGIMCCQGKLAKFSKDHVFPNASMPKFLVKHGCLRQMGSSSKRNMSFLGANGSKFLENHPFALGNTLFLRELELKTWFSGQLG